MSKHEPRLLIEDIQEASDKIKQYVAGFTFDAKLITDIDKIYKAI